LQFAKHPAVLRKHTANKTAKTNEHHKLRNIEQQTLKTKEQQITLAVTATFYPQNLPTLCLYYHMVPYRLTPGISTAYAW
jgi:hypothetical protein